VRWAFFLLFFLHGFSIGNGQQGISYNGRGLVAVGKFEKLLLNHQIKLIRSTQLKTCTSAPIATNPC